MSHAPHSDLRNHCLGQTPYLDDFAPRSARLRAQWILSKAIGRFSLVRPHALESDTYLFLAKDIPGENQIGSIQPDEPLLAEGISSYVGQPLAICLSSQPQRLATLVASIQITYDEELPLLDPQQALKQNEKLFPSRVMVHGSPDHVFAQCPFVVEGTVRSGAQEHLYLETQACLATLTTDGRIYLLSSTQSPTAVQKAVARVLGLPQHLVEVEATRLGGAFGGKEDQATATACGAALGTFLTQSSVYLTLSRVEDMTLTGKRHPYQSTYRLGADRRGRLMAFEATYLQDGGAFTDLSPAVLDRTLYHALNAYTVPHVRLTAHSVRTGTCPHTAFRGFGAPQGALVIECALTHLAEVMNISKTTLQRLNLVQRGQVTHYGQRLKHAKAIATFEALDQQVHLKEWQHSIDQFNRENHRWKRGFALQPICFGISFTNTRMNQAGALVHLYADGSVGLSSGAVEMGQQVFQKLVQVAQTVLGLSETPVVVYPTNTTRVANTSPTAASAAADLNGHAIRLACLSLRQRLLRHAAVQCNCRPEDLSLAQDHVIGASGARLMTFPALVQSALAQRVDCSAHAHYATPGLSVDHSGCGSPFAYHVYGTAAWQATVDLLLGTYALDRVQLVHDGGHSLNYEVDRGQIEGALAQGMGWTLMEEWAVNDQGRPLTASLATYKVPMMGSMPPQFAVSFLPSEPPSPALFRSKAVGEPPLLYGLGAYFAVRDAIARANAGKKSKKVIRDHCLPLTPERCLHLVDLGLEDYVRMILPKH
jgi:xanthine dehydrogenase large subunit